MSNVLIVESGAKAQTLQRYLGAGWRVVATGGHVETLPHDRRLHGREAGKAFWMNRPGELPAPPWVWTERGEGAVTAIIGDADDGSPVFWIATDPDREGEFIAWSLERRLHGLGDFRRVTFQEVTEGAVREAIGRPRGLDRGMVDSALVRKFLDRLVGYRTSKMASAIVSGTEASMGRVQTPTLGFVVDRELEREAHVPIPYFEVQARAGDVAFSVRFHEPNDPDAWRDDGGKPNPVRTSDGGTAAAAFSAIERTNILTLTSVATSTRRAPPEPPFSTDALLQAAGSRFGWSPRKTSALASMLYEGGHITYIRTDSIRLADVAVARASEIIAAKYGADHVGEGAHARASAGPVQDAHEAIRPTRLEITEPPVEDADARRLYRLILARTLASRMAPSVRTVVRLTARCDGLARPLTGSVSWRTFAGWEAAFEEFLDAPLTAPPDVAMEAGAVWTLDEGEDGRPNPILIEDATRPPPRYRPHTLIRAMKDAGIGRPSTYSRTVEKLEERSYIAIEDGSVVPTERGRTLWLDVAPLYEAGDAGTDADLPMSLFNAEFTATMEAELDRIATGEAEAPVTWELWRDRIRELHAGAQERRNSGGIAPSQLHTLQRLVVNAAPGARVGGITVPADISALTFAEARDLIRALRAAGVQPAPTERQLDYLRSLVKDLGLEADELQELVGFRDSSAVDGLDTTARVSAAIDTLKQVHDERRPPSARQRRFIEALLSETGASETDALAAVGAGSLDELTGGPGGTASALIDWLKEHGAARVG